MSEVSEKKDNERRESGKPMNHRSGGNFRKNGSRSNTGRNFHGGKSGSARSDRNHGDESSSRGKRTARPYDRSKPHSDGAKTDDVRTNFARFNASKNAGADDVKSGRAADHRQDRPHGKRSGRYGKGEGTFIREKEIAVMSDAPIVDIIDDEDEYQIPERKTRTEAEVSHTLKAGSDKKLLSLLGFAARGRKIICGTDLCRDSIRRNTAIITIIASDASANTKKRIIDACRYYGSDMCVAPVASAELSHMIGKTGEIMVISVTDRHFADGIAALFEDSGSN